jgi:hypothetical protein
LDPKDRKPSPGATLDQNKTYFVLATMGEYKVQNGSVVMRLMVSPPVPVFKYPAFSGERGVFAALLIITAFLTYFPSVSKHLHLLDQYAPFCFDEKMNIS